MNRVTSVMVHYGHTGEQITVGQKYLGEKVTGIQPSMIAEYPIVNIITEGREHQLVGFPYALTREGVKV